VVRFGGVLVILAPRPSLLLFSFSLTLTHVAAPERSVQYTLSLDTRDSTGQRTLGWVHTEEADHSSLMIKRMNCELTRLLRQQTSTQPGPTTSHETALGRTARASALVGRFAWSKTQEEDELVEVPNEDSEAVAAVLVVIRRDCGLLVLNRLIHNSVSLRKAPEGIGYR